MTESINSTLSLSKTRKYTTKSTLSEAITPMTISTSPTSPMLPFPKDFPTPKSAEGADSQCVLKGLSPVPGAVWYQRKVLSLSNTKTGSKVDKLLKARPLPKD